MKYTYNNLFLVAMNVIDKVCPNTERSRYGKHVGDSINGIPLDVTKLTVSPAPSEHERDEINAELKWRGVNVFWQAWWLTNNGNERVWTFCDPDEIDAAYRGEWL